MNLNEYQLWVTDLVSHDSREHLAFGLAEEAGEICGKFKRLMRGDFKQKAEAEFPITCLDHGYNCEMEKSSCPDHLRHTKIIDRTEQLFRAALVLEMGDVLFYLAALAHRHGLSLEGVARLNFDKLVDRRTRGVFRGEGDKR